MHPLDCTLWLHLELRDNTSFTISAPVHHGKNSPSSDAKLWSCSSLHYYDSIEDTSQLAIPLGVSVLQGTLYPDVIESCPPPGSGQKHSHTIKSHHNVGGLPKDLDFTLIEPLRELFKVSSLHFRYLSCLHIHSLCSLYSQCSFIAFRHPLAHSPLLFATSRPAYRPPQGA